MGQAGPNRPNAPGAVDDGRRRERRLGQNDGRGPRDWGNNLTLRNNRSINLANPGYRPSFARHSWYRGGWGGPGYWNRGAGWGYGGPGYAGGWGGPYAGYGWGGYGGYGYGYRPLAWGLGGWGLGSLLYSSGYLGYSNPYFGSTSNYVYDYSQPVPVAYTQSVPQYDTGVDPADELLNQAIAAFRQNDYDAALSTVDRAIASDPNDAVLHEFRSLVLFAKADYRTAAATIHSVLAVGPGWDWATMSSLYSDVSVYTAQLRGLEMHLRENADDTAARFLLAYHYMSSGHPDAAAVQFEKVVKANPDDRVARDLLRLAGAPKQGAQASTQTPDPAPSPPADSVPTVDAGRIVGNWKAHRDDGSQFELTLNPDSTFSWRFSAKGQSAQEFTGRYSVDGNVLALERDEGDALMGAITQSNDGRFNFKLVGAPPEDPGLNFAR